LDVSGAISKLKFAVMEMFTVASSGNIEHFANVTETSICGNLKE